ncbi:MAG: YfcE family phosphodiesterase [Armatimonadetes bacterium]|nr:YfcE family phosphodiesterase [Armatimonadota bacterium]
MKLGIISDTHKNLDYLKKVIQIFKDERIDLFIHLGDDYSDLKDYDDFIKLVKIPGVYDPEYKDSNIPHREILKIEEIKILLTHSPESHENDFPADLDPLELAKKENINLILYGHTHIPAIQEKENLLWVNPGHLKIEDKKGYPPTYSIIDISGRSIEAKIINLLENKEIFIKKKNL